MWNQNSIYGIFNQNQIQEQFRQMQMQQYHNDQMHKSMDCARKLDDFLKSIDDVDPEYQKIAFEQCCMVLGNHMMKHQQENMKSF